MDKDRGGGTAGGFAYDMHDDGSVGMMPVRDDGRYQFLKDYTDVVTDYALIANAGTTVNWLINEENVDKADIDYERVREYWTDGDESKTYSDWTWRIKPLFDVKQGGESEEAKAWLDRIIRQQAEEAVSTDNVSARKVKTKDGTGYNYPRKSKPQVK